jgi:hypothetical protein
MLKQEGLEPAFAEASFGERHSEKACRFALVNQERAQMLAGRHGSGPWAGRHGGAVSRDSLLPFQSFCI